MNVTEQIAYLIEHSFSILLLAPMLNRVTARILYYLLFLINQDKLACIKFKYKGDVYDGFKRVYEAVHGNSVNNSFVVERNTTNYFLITLYYLE